jgi:hypothetical protein
VTHIREAEIVLLGPEERHGVKPFAPAEHVARGSLPLACGVVQIVRGRARARLGATSSPRRRFRPKERPVEPTRHRREGGRPWLAAT